jgi:Uma2 family endonuclease
MSAAATASSTVSDFPRRKFTAEDVQDMLKAGILTHDDRVELIEGELVEMAAHGPVHRDLDQKLITWFIRHALDGVAVAPPGPLRLGPRNEPEPDFFLFPETLGVNAVKGPDTLLVVEISDTTLRKDVKLKGPLYARHGVREYWVIDVDGRQTRVFSNPGPQGYPEPRLVDFASALDAPGVKERLVIAGLLDP